jgi:hypothetical protein
MANVLPKDKQISVIAALAEGNSIRSIERMTGIHRDSIMRLGVRIGQGCARLLDEKMRNLDCKRLELDECWGYIAKKMRHVTPEDDPTFGDVWTYCAIDSDTKLVPAYHVSSTRDLVNTAEFIADLASRLNNRIQLSTDAMNSYEEAVETVFGIDIDYGQIVKTYQSEDGREYNPERRYSQPRIPSSKKTTITGSPEYALISTSYIERLNASELPRSIRGRVVNREDYIEELKAAILNVHSATATHVETVPVVEEFQGETVWEGEVEVFDIRGHPKAKRCYGWGYSTDDDQRQYVAVLELPPVTSPQTAVKAAVVSEIKNAREKKKSRTP